MHSPTPHNKSIKHDNTQHAHNQHTQRRLPYPARALALRLGLGPGGQLFSAAQLSGLASDDGRLCIAILGQVFDVSSRPDFYGAGGGYAHFVGTDGSLSFMTGVSLCDVVCRVPVVGQERGAREDTQAAGRSRHTAAWHAAFQETPPRCLSA